MTVAKIREAFTEAEFYATDIIEVPAADPFLAVRFHDLFLVIERWDEPGFRM